MRFVVRSFVFGFWFFVLALLAPGIWIPPLLAEQTVDYSRAINDQDAQATGASLEAFVDGVVTTTMQEHHIPGLTLSIVVDDEVLLVKGYGLADRESGVLVDPEKHLFRIGSITKTITFTALMQLVEKGLVELDSDVNTYLSDFQIPEAFGAPVRIRDLLTHRPGFEEVYRGLWAPSAEAFEANGDWLKNNIPARVFKPGTVTSYSNYGTALAGYIVETVSGIPYEDYVAKHIFEPLDMASTTARQLLPNNHPQAIPPSLAERLAKVYTWQQGHVRPYHFEWVVGAPAGSVSATSSDMAQLMRTFLNSGRRNEFQLLKSETIAQMQSRPYPDRRSAGYAHGFRTGELGGHKTFEHGGATFTSYSGMVMVPDLNIGVFIGTNAGNSPMAPTEAARHIIRYLANDQLAEQPSGIDRGKLDDFIGTYMTTRREYEGSIKLFSAFSGISNATISSENSLLLSNQQGVEEYVPVAPDTLANTLTGETISFIRGADGQVVRYVNEYGNSSNERVTAATNPQMLWLALAISNLLAITQLIAGWKRKSATMRTNIVQWVRLTVRSSVPLAIGVIVTTALLGIMIIQVSGLGNEFLFVWPLSITTAFLWSVLALLVATMLYTGSLIPLTLFGQVSIWHKGHMVLFCASLINLIIHLNYWNLVGFKYW